MPLTAAAFDTRQRGTRSRLEDVIVPRVRIVNEKEPERRAPKDRGAEGAEGGEVWGGGVFLF